MTVPTTDALDWVNVARAITKWVRTGSGLDQNHVFWAYEGKARPQVPPYIVLSITQIRGVGHDWNTYEENPFEFAPMVVAGVASSVLNVPGHPFGNGDGPVQLASTGGLPAPLVPATDYWVIVVDADHIKLASTFVATGGQQPLGDGNPQTPITLTTSGTGTISISPTIDTVQAGKELVSRAQGFREVIVHLDCFVAEGKGYDAMRILSNVVASLQLNLYDLDQAGVGVSDMGQAFSQGGVAFVEGHRGGILEPRAMVDLTFYLASNIIGYETIIDDIVLPFRIPTPQGGAWSSGFSSGFGG